MNDIQGFAAVKFQGQIKHFNFKERQEYGSNLPELHHILWPWSKWKSVFGKITDLQTGITWVINRHWAHRSVDRATSTNNSTESYCYWCWECYQRFCAACPGFWRKSDKKHSLSFKLLKLSQEEPFNLSLLNVNIEQSSMKTYQGQKLDHTKIYYSTD